MGDHIWDVLEMFKELQNLTEKYFMYVCDLHGIASFPALLVFFDSTQKVEKNTVAEINLLKVLHCSSHLRSLLPVA